MCGTTPGSTGIQPIPGRATANHPMAHTHLAVCRHEAAHAVVLERFGGRWLEAHAPLFTHNKKRGRGYVGFGDVRKIGPVQLSCVLMAGSVAEYLWHGTPRGLVSAYDLHDLKAAGLKGEDFRIVWQETERIVRKLKPAIWKLAEQLRCGERLRPRVTPRHRARKPAKRKGAR